MDADRRTRLHWTVAIFTFVATDAIGFQLRGALLPSIQAEFDVATGLLGLVATAGTVGFIVSVLVVGLAAGRVDIRLATLASAAVVGVSSLLMGLAPAFVVYLAMLFVRGVATGPFRALDRAILSHLFPAGRAKIFNLYALVWALGATVGPVVVVAALKIGNWRWAYLVVVAGFLLSAVYISRLDLPTSVSEEPISLADLKRVVRKPAVAGMSGMLLLNGGIEGTLFTWLPYFAAQQFPQATASLVLSTFLAAYIPGRLFYSYLTDRTGRTLDVVLVTATVALPLLVATVFLADGLALFATVFGLGFTVSATFPTLSAFGVAAAPEFSGPVNALATSAGYLGIGLVPPIVGLLATRFGLTAALGSLPVLLATLVVLALVTRSRLAVAGAPATAEG